MMDYAFMHMPKTQKKKKKKTNFTLFPINPNIPLRYEEINILLVILFVKYVLRNLLL